MKEVIDEDINELSSETFEKILIALSKKPGQKYKFITRAGNSFKLALLNLFQIIWRTECIPSEWHESNVIQLPKGNKCSNSLENIRHIHDRNLYSKFFSQIVMAQAKPNLFENLSKYQIACRPGHRPSEHLFVIKIVFAKYDLEKRGS